MKPKVTQSERDYILAHAKTMTPHEMSKHLDRAYKTVYGVLEENKIKPYRKIAHTACYKVQVVPDGCFDWRLPGDCSWVM